MTTSFRRTPGSRALLIATAALAMGATTLAAQQRTPGRFDSATAPAPVPVSRPPALVSRPSTLQQAVLPQAARAPFPRVAFGTAIGGILGGAIGAAAGAAVGGLEGEKGGFISASEALGAIGVAVGYPVGAAIGARMGATVDGARPSLGRLVLISSLGAVAGGLVWNRVGEGFESQESMTSWYMGAGAGLATHWIITAVAAQRAPAVPPRAVAAPGDPGA